ncbi:hypothetical protein J2Y38_004088 [Flavobacterium sp. 2755]|uniref:hypothetical protein n=1 Tax=Flavobacterium sp. 2755 TaxID=2817765 RepID=UPI002862C988|nr:hypothetical protein [Flavobacterium sp. 2755]MDR6763864.1 hypothetical protein [Flavobacterium sp. 2755]
MKSKKVNKTINKFSLEKFEVAKLKNLRIIKGGDAPDDPIDGTGNKGGNSSGDCR